MFADLLHLKTMVLFHSDWPGAEIQQDCTLGSGAGHSTSASWHGISQAWHCASTSTYNMAWNYGANFGGPTKSTWTSGANSLSAGNSDGKGAFGSFFLAEPRYAVCKKDVGS